MDSIVFGLVKTALKRSHINHASDQDIDITAKALVHKISKMPLILKTAMTLLTRFFHMLSGNEQQRIEKNYDSWAKSPISVLGSFTAFYEKMSLFIYFSLCKNKS